MKISLNNGLGHAAVLVAALSLGTAPGAVAAAEVKVGFVNVPRVLDRAPQAEAARKRIEEEFAPRDRELLASQRRVRGEEDRLVKNGAIMSASERQKLESEIRAFKRGLRRNQEEFREDLNLRKSQELAKLQRKVREVIQAMAKAEQYDLIVTDGVVFAGGRVDMTKRVIDQLNGEFKSSN